MIRGYYSWNWGVGSAPAGANAGVAFTGLVDVTAAQEGYTPGASWCCPALEGTKYLSLGGGNSAGMFTQKSLQGVIDDVDKINMSAYDGVIFDVEEVVGPSSTMIPLFGEAFAAMKKRGLLVGITTSHSAPYQTDEPADAVAFVKAWVADPRVDLLSPQLYSSGGEAKPEFAPTASCAAAGCTWELYRGAKAKLVPSIVDATQYDEVAAWFAANLSVKTAGFFEWAQHKSMERPEPLVPVETEANGQVVAPPPMYLQDLFHQLDPRLPSGDYRIPSLVATTNGTLLAFIMGRFHRTDSTPNIVYLRRSHDDGNTWEEAIPILVDPTNRTEFGGAPVVDPATGDVLFVFEKSGGHCGGCAQWLTRSSDNGKTWTTPQPANVSGSGQPANATWGGALASGIALKNGPHKGRLMVALRHDCACSKMGSLVVYSDDGGATWRGGDVMQLLPQYGGGWTECQVAELKNGSVLLTSRNFYGTSSGQGPRLMARSDDGGATWAANWTAFDLPDPYCEASVLSDGAGGLFFGNPSHPGHRLNYSVHQSLDGGRTWPQSVVVYPGDAAYSDMAFTRNGSIAVLFEKDNYNTVAFGVVPLPPWGGVGGAPSPAAVEEEAEKVDEHDHDGDGDGDGDAPMPASCDFAVVGGGWAGIYAAWRVAVDAKLLPAHKVCVLEASDRFGGRTYTVREDRTPFVDGLNVDIGAYRFAFEQHLPADLIRHALKLPTACYMPSCAREPLDGNLTLHKLTDPRTNSSSGYATALDRMLADLKAAGAVLRTGAALEAVIGAADGGSGLALHWRGGGGATAAPNVFLNLPRHALMKLRGDSAVFTEAQPAARALYNCSHELKDDGDYNLTYTKETSVKVYLVYEDAWWRTELGLVEGEVSSPSKGADDPSVYIRYHDGPVHCEPTTGKCRGALLVQYAHSLQAGSAYYMPFRGANASDPLTVIPAAARPVEGGEAARGAGGLPALIHAKLLKMHAAQLKAKGIAPAAVAAPTAAVLGYWPHELAESLHPAPTPLSFSTAALPPCLHGVDSKSYSALVRKPVPSRQILVANNDWWLEESKLDLVAPYWAEVGLRVAERVLHDHMGMAKPAWLDEAYFESNVLGI